MKSETAKSLNQSPKEKELLEEKQRETITKSNYLVEKTRRGLLWQHTYMIVGEGTEVQKI